MNNICEIPTDRVVNADVQTFEFYIDEDGNAKLKQN